MFAVLAVAYGAAQMIALVAAIVVAIRGKEDPRFAGDKIIYRS